MNRGHRICEICGIQEKRCMGKMFFARFPLLEHICKQWVKVVGKQDLIHLPLEKLHDLRYVCGRHFENRQLTKTKTRLKKNAVPKLQLTMPPLPDELLENFPLHMAGKNDDITLHSFPNPCDVTRPEELERFRTWVLRVGGDIVGEDNKFIHRNKYVCHRHFEDNVVYSPKKLNRLAIPTLHIPDIPTHRFPNLNKFPEQFQIWVTLAGGKLDKSSDYDYYRKRIICDKHFTPADKTHNNWLNRLAVPSLYLPEKNQIAVFGPINVHVVKWKGNVEIIM